MKPIVISISGISGAGKSTVATALYQKTDNSVLLCFDDYNGDLLGRDYCEWSEDGADANEWNLSEIINDVEKLIQNEYKYVIVDYPFGRAHEEISSLTDISVFVDTPLDIALARRTVRDYCLRAPNRKPLPNPLEQLSNSIQFYLERHRATYQQHIKTVLPTCDMIVDGTKSTDEICDEISAYIDINLSKKDSLNSCRNNTNKI